MSVPKHKRKESQFEVVHHFYKLRRKVTDYLLRNFGYDYEKFMKQMDKSLGDKTYEDLDEKERKAYDKKVKKNLAFDKWFVENERNLVVECLRNITEEIFMANSIYPNYSEELIERRIHQDRAIGQCYRLLQELQYIVETLPVKVDKYLPYAQDIDKEIALLKAWRKSDNKFKGKLCSASNFANVNNNGNANDNNASNANGVRPDFDATI